jgi:F0F1-type ATP synthase membrane subunit a
LKCISSLCDTLKHSLPLLILWGVYSHILWMLAAVLFLLRFFVLFWLAHKEPTQSVPSYLKNWAGSGQL